MKTLVVYYSLQGNTKKVAEILHEELKGDMAEIKTIKPYNMATALTVGKIHINKKTIVEIEDLDIKMDDYDEIIIGTPVWWYTFAPPIRSFLSKYDIKGKEIKIFCTHAGNAGKTIEHMKELIGEENIMADKEIYAGKKILAAKNLDKWRAIEEEVLQWIRHKID